MKKFLITSAWTVLLAITGTASFSATAQTSTGSATQVDSLYAALGEKAGLVNLMDDFMARLLTDPRTAPHFKEAGQKHLKEMLVQQFCKVSGGPCEYTGGDMKSVHGGLDITKTDFNALVEVLQQSMDARGIAFSAQNQLLARLAPLHRDIITVK